MCTTDPQADAGTASAGPVPANAGTTTATLGDTILHSHAPPIAA
jgi:hypothetical protein